MEIINWPLLKQPTNWLTIILMVVIAGAVFHLIMKHWSNN